MPQPLYQLRCRGCRWNAIAGVDEMAQWLRDVGMLRANKAPEPEILRELFTYASDRYRCPECDKAPLKIEEIDEQDDEQWGMARACEVCRKPILAERLEIFPDERMCAACKTSNPDGAVQPEVDYCPRCGSVMEMKHGRGQGVTRYSLVCPSCGR